MSPQGRACGRAGRSTRRPRPRVAAMAPAAVSIDAPTWSAYAAHGVGVAVLGHAGYPAALADDPDPPACCSTAATSTRSTDTLRSIVGTRRCTRVRPRRRGRARARPGGVRACASCPGLALGHRRRRAPRRARRGADGGAPPIGVVGSGLDVVYPRGHRGSVGRGRATRASLLSEAPLGVRPSAWRFPARNRIIAALGAVPWSSSSRTRVAARCTPSTKPTTAAVP